MFPEIYQQIHTIFILFDNVAFSFRSDKNIIQTIYSAIFNLSNYIKSTCIKYFVGVRQTETIN